MIMITIYNRFNQNSNKMNNKKILIKFEFSYIFI